MIHSRINCDAKRTAAPFEGRIRFVSLHDGQ